MPARDWRCCVCGKDPGTNWVDGKRYCNDCRPLSDGSFYGILSRIKRIIVRLNDKKGSKSDFSKMTPASTLKDYGISHFRDRGLLQRWFGSYIDTADLYAAVNEHFKLKQYDDLKTSYDDWQIMSDVVAYVQESLNRQQVEREREERDKQDREEQKRLERSRRAKENRAKRKAKEQKEKRRQERSRRMKEYWVKRKAKEPEDKDKLEEQERKERREPEEGKQQPEETQERPFVMEPYTEMNSPEELKRVLDHLTKKIKKFENRGESRLAAAFIRRKQRIWNRLQKVERGEISDRGRQKNKKT